MTSGLRPTSLVLVALTVLSGCDGTPKAAPKVPAIPVDSAPASTTEAASSSRAPAPRVRKWIDLSVGDCLADPPPTDPGVITVDVVDCAGPHAAEVFARVPVAVDAAIASVANRECATGFTGYTGESEGAGALTVSYLIDSDQDRTSANPDPSTVICLLQNANGQPLTGSARR